MKKNRQSRKKINKDSENVFKKMNFWKLVGMFLLCLLFFLQLGVNNLLATKGGEIKTIEAQRALLEEEKTILKQKIAHNSSLYYIEQQCQKTLSFNKTKNNVLYISPEKMASLK